MTQPNFVPIAEADQVRPARSLAVPAPWMATRPAELRVPTRPISASLGTPGPDQGFALRLARRFEDQLRRGPGENAEDIIEGAALIASRRAGLFGRAPSVYDVRLALELFGFLVDAPADLVAERTTRFRGVAHDYVAQRALVDGIPEPVLGLTPDEVAAKVATDWRSVWSPAESAGAASGAPATGGV
jgi:hypothetical protein